jgi:cytidylate kinase
MAIITISRWAFSKGQEIAEKVADRLGYRCVSQRVLLEASEEFNIPEVKLERALHDAPSVLNRFTLGKERYIAFIRQAFLEEVQHDDVVYHGAAGHFFVEGVNHVLKVRIVADMEERIELEMKRENLSRDEARSLLEKDDEERRKWSLSLYGIDTAEATLYDLVIHLFKVTSDDAVDLICETAQLPAFQATPESQSILDNLLLAAQAKSAIVRQWPQAKVSADNGEVTVQVEAALAHEDKIFAEVSQRIGKLPGVSNVRVNVQPYLYD